MTVKVEQKGISDSFKAVLPVKIEFDEGYAVGRVQIVGAKAESFLVLPRKPTDVEFNFFGGVLAR